MERVAEFHELHPGGGGNGGNGCPRLHAPLGAGEVVGSVKVLWGGDDRVLSEVPLVATQAVERAGVMKRLWDRLLLSLD